MQLVRRALSLVLMMVVAMTLLPGTVVQASDAGGSEQGSDSDLVIITDKDKPYLAFGADLTEEEKSKVLGYMGLSKEDLLIYDVATVTNSEEHQYLGSYISSKEIGSRALSSVVIKKTGSGSGVNVSTYNINYCTAGMYKNALATAGVTDADLIVAGPFPISGTAALVGVMKAYEQMTGEELNETAVDAALNELVVTGAIESADKADSGKVEAMIAELKEMAADGKLGDEQAVRDAIDKASEEYGITLDESEISKLTDFLMKLKDLDLNWDNIRDQAQSVAQKLQDTFGDKLGDIESQGFWDKVAGFFKKIIDAIRGLFS